MSKTQKAEIVEEKKLGFENAPKLFSRWSYDDFQVPLFLNPD